MFRAGRALAATGMALAILVATVLGYPAVLAQPDTSPGMYTSELTGWTIEVPGPDFALDDVALEEYPHGRGERVAINGVGALSYAEVAFFDDTDLPEDTIAVTMREFQATSQEFAVLDSGVTDGVTYTLASFRLNANVTGYFYMEVDPDIHGNVDLAQSLFTLNLDFPEQLALASGQVMVNGNAFLGDPVADVAGHIAAHLEANPQATPEQTTYAFETADSAIQVNPPVTLDYYSNANGFESVNVSHEDTFGIIGYLQQEASGPEEILTGIFASAPVGNEAPDLIHSDRDTEQVFAVYRIHRDGDVTIMVIQVIAIGPGLWRVEAVAGNEGTIAAELDVFQQSISIDGVPILDTISSDALIDILNDYQP